MPPAFAWIGPPSGLNEQYPDKSGDNPMCDDARLQQPVPILCEAVRLKVLPVLFFPAVDEEDHASPDDDQPCKSDQPATPRPTHHGGGPISNRGIAAALTAGKKK